MNKNRLVILVLGAAFIFAAALFFFSDPLRTMVEARVCVTSFEEKAKVIDCWYRLLDRALKNGGVEEAMKVFAYLYDTEDLFTYSGCHRHAHKIGDLAYFDLYLNDPDLDRLDFPPETTSCTYGFYHGFFEHFFQDNPEPVFISESCRYFEERLLSTIPWIRANCYHGSGHGILLAHAEALPESSWGNSTKFLAEPLHVCQSLPDAEEKDIRECMQGIFTIFANWMVDEEHGFSYNFSDPFAPCRVLSKREADMCYHQIMEKLAGAFRYSPSKLREVALQIPSEHAREIAYIAATSVLVQNTIKDGSFTAFIPTCLELDGVFADWCTRGAVIGLFNFGEPMREYEKALVLCSLDLLEEPRREVCYEELVRNMQRFYPVSVRVNVCAAFPSTYRHICLD